MIAVMVGKSVSSLNLDFEKGLEFRLICMQLYFEFMRYSHHNIFIYILYPYTLLEKQTRFLQWTICFMLL